MGAVCYKPKPTLITKEEVLKALSEKHSLNDWPYTIE